MLQTSASGLLLHDIEEVVRIRIVDDGGDAEGADKSISSIKLDEADEYSLKMRVEFSDTDAITTDISDPDVLRIELLKPGLFVDAETLEPIDSTSRKVEVELKP